MIAQAVSHTHSLGIIHCDIKPSNVYVGVRDGPLLFDFGFARSHSTQDAVSGGTLAYMAPEQLRAFLDPQHWSEVGPAADIYALGLTLVELLLGILPDMTPPTMPAPLAARELLGRRLRPDWLVRTTLRHIPPALGEIVQRCLAPSPEERYTEASELARSLGHFLVPPTNSSVCPSLAIPGLPGSMAWCQIIPSRCRRGLRGPRRSSGIRPGRRLTRPAEPAAASICSIWDSTVFGSRSGSFLKARTMIGATFDRPECPNRT